MKEVAPELVEGKSEWELLNMPTKEIVDLTEKAGEKFDDIKVIQQEVEEIYEN